MRITLSLPDEVARKFQTTVPARHRSRLVAALIQRELRRRASALEAACVAANRDKRLEKEIDEWQAFEDGLTE